MVEADIGIQDTFKELKVTAGVLRWIYGASLGVSLPSFESAIHRICEQGIAYGAVWSDVWSGAPSKRLRIVNRLDSKFADLGYYRVLRAELFPIQVRLHRLFPYLECPPASDEVQLNQYLLLHHNGSMALSIFIEYADQSISVHDAVRLASLGLEETLLDYKLPSFDLVSRDRIPFAETVDKGWVQGVSLETFVNHIIVPAIRRAVIGRHSDGPRGSIHSLFQYTVNTLIDSWPKCNDLRKFATEYGTELKAISDMDLVGFTRHAEVIHERFSENLSIDNHVGVFLGARRGTILFEWPGIQEWFIYADRRYGIKDHLDVNLEIGQHYILFVEWALIEESSIRSYLAQLSPYIQHPQVDVGQIIKHKLLMLSELEEFLDGVTSFDYGMNIVNKVNSLSGLEKLRETFRRKQSIVEQIVLDRENWRLQNRMLGLNVILLISLGLELTEIAIQYSKFQPGSRQWIMWKLAPVVLIFLVFAVYYLNRGFVRCIELAKLGMQLEISSRLGKKITEFIQKRSS